MRNFLITIFTFFIITASSYGQGADSLVNVDDVEFSTGTQESSSEDTLISDLGGVEFSSGEDTASVSKDSTATTTPAESSSIDAKDDSSTTLWSIFIKGLLGGFLAFLMPCIFPMVPLTVSFFTKKASSPAAGIRQAFLYGLFIIVIYVALGMLITVFFGADALNKLSTNGIFNFLFFLLLVVFAASFFGAFEITLPSSMVNKIDSQSDKGGLIGLFFMSASLAVVSFSCTGPIIGTLLVDAATKGDRLGPAVGMFGFSLALAIPFVLFAAFPSLLKSMPKSGGWLNSIKVVLGFLELALALKFLSNVDLAYNWQFLDREVFLGLWIVIFGLMGLYLIGKIKFSHDSELKYLSFPRTIIAIIVFSFVVYMIPGMWGAPLKSISAFLPPIGTQDFDISAGVQTQAHGTKDASSRKYYSHFHPRTTLKGMDPYYDYDEALAAAKEQNKPLLVDFTGWNCVNCRKMESNVWSDPAVKKLINEEFILVELFVDDSNLELPESEQYISKLSGKKITMVSRKNAEMQIEKFNNNAQPLYALLNKEEQLLVPTSGANYDIASYKAYLEKALAAYKAK